MINEVNNVCLLLFNNHYNTLTSLPAWYGQNYYCIECEVLVNQLEYVVNAQRKTVCPSPHLPNVAKSVLALFVIVPVSEITWKTVYVTIQSHVTQVASGSSVQCLNTYAIYHIAVIVQNLSN